MAGHGSPDGLPPAHLQDLSIPFFLLCPSREGCTICSNFSIAFSTLKSKTGNSLFQYHRGLQDHAPLPVLFLHWSWDMTPQQGGQSIQRSYFLLLWAAMGWVRGLKGNHWHFHPDKRWHESVLCQEPEAKPSWISWTFAAGPACQELPGDGGVHQLRREQGPTARFPARQYLAQVAQVRITFGTPLPWRPCCLNYVSTVSLIPSYCSLSHPTLARSSRPSLQNSSCAMPSGRPDGSAKLSAARPLDVQECRQPCDQRGLCHFPSETLALLWSTLTSDRQSSCCLAALRFQLVIAWDALQRQVFQLHTEVPWQSF